MADDAGGAGQQPPQRMAAVHLVVAVGQQQHRGEVGDAPDQVAQQVQGGLVGPVHVLHDQHGGVPGPVQLVQQRGEERVPVAGVAQRPGQVGTDAAGEVADRAQHARRRQVVAVAHEEPRVGWEVVAQLAHQARLADAGLAGDQDHGTGSRRSEPGGVGQRRQLGLPLEHPALGHASMVRPLALVGSGSLGIL